MTWFYIMVTPSCLEEKRVILMMSPVLFEHTVPQAQCTHRPVSNISEQSLHQATCLS